MTVENTDSTEMEMKPLAVEVRGLTKTYPGDVQAVRGIDFDVFPGEVFGLLGPNGAGKSTTVGMLTGTVAPTAGTARLAGWDVVAEPLAARRASAVVFQESVVDRPLTGRRNLEIHARLWGVEPAKAGARLHEVVEAFGLGEIIDRPVGSYSGGQRRRLELARALLSRASRRTRQRSRHSSFSPRRWPASRARRSLPKAIPSRRAPRCPGTSIPTPMRSPM